MNMFKTVLISVVTLGAVAAAAAADARGGFHHRSRVGVGVFIGAPLYPYYYPRYYYPPAYYPGPYAYYPAPAPAAPPVYIEQSPAASAPSAPPQAAGAYWYYCRDSQAYYPYVQQCASPWQQVQPQSGPPGPQSGPVGPEMGPHEPQAGPPYGPPAAADPESVPPT